MMFSPFIVTVAPGMGTLLKSLNVSHDFLADWLNILVNVAWFFIFAAMNKFGDTRIIGLITTVITVQEPQRTQKEPKDLPRRCGRSLSN